MDSRSIVKLDLKKKKKIRENFLKIRENFLKIRENFLKIPRPHFQLLLHSILRKKFFSFFKILRKVTLRPFYLIVENLRTPPSHVTNISASAYSLQRSAIELATSYGFRNLIQFHSLAKSLKNQRRACDFF